MNWPEVNATIWFCHSLFTHVYKWLIYYEKKRRLIVSVCCTDLMRNFHVFACRAMSRLEITKQMSSRVWITEEDFTNLLWLWAEDCPEGTKHHQGTSQWRKKTQRTHLLQYQRPPPPRCHRWVTSCPTPLTDLSGACRPPWRVAAGGRPPGTDDHSKLPHCPEERVSTHFHSHRVTSQKLSLCWQVACVNMPESH